MAAAATVRSAPADESLRPVAKLRRPSIARRPSGTTRNLQQNAGDTMNKRLLTAAIGLALCALAAPAHARPHMYDDDGSATYRQRGYDRDDDDDDERSYRRERRRHQQAT